MGQMKIALINRFPDFFKIFFKRVIAQRQSEGITAIRTVIDPPDNCQHRQSSVDLASPRRACQPADGNTSLPCRCSIVTYRHHSLLPAVGAGEAGKGPPKWVPLWTCFYEIHRSFQPWLRTFWNIISSKPYLVHFPTADYPYSDLFIWTKNCTHSIFL